MSFKKLVLKSTASIEIEDAIAYYYEINKTIAKKLEEEIRFCFKKFLKTLKLFNLDMQQFVLYG